MSTEKSKTPKTRIKSMTRGSSSKKKFGTMAELNTAEPPTYREVIHHINFLTTVSQDVR